jgi:hypothetical protein
LQTNQITYLSDIFKCPATKIQINKTALFNSTTYMKIVNDFIKVFDELESMSDSQMISEQGMFAACILRTAGHDFMDYRIN